MAGRTSTKPQWPPGKARLKALIEEAIVDAYNESEQRVAFYTLLDEHLDTPFDTQVLGTTATVERIDMTADDQIVAVCRRGRVRQVIPILDLRLPNPPPPGAQWIEAYRLWTTGK
jgi:Calcium binding